MDRRNYYKIGELSKLYNIGVDSIRYYEEAGLLNPKRDANNNYRLYSLDDIRKLTMIRELLSLNFSLEQIKAFDDHRTIKNSIGLLEKELNIIDKSIEKLVQTKNSIQNRLSNIQNALTKTEFLDQIRILHLSKRNCVMISDTNLPDDYVDYAVSQYIKNHHQGIHTIGACDCYTLDVENSNPKSNLLRTKNVFFYSPNPMYESNYTLPAGDYLSVIYSGSYDNTKQWVKRMFLYAKEHSLKSISDPIEFGYINEYETADEMENIIEVQMQIEPL